MQQPLAVHSSNEVQYYLLATPCEVCGKGPSVLHAIAPGDKPQDVSVAKATCQACGSGRLLAFVSKYEPTDPDSPCISPIDEPSEVVDLDQWLGLYYQLADQADREDYPPRAHELNIRAALCLAEALKFYDSEDELPPESAFFSETTLVAFRQHPQNFPRQLLRDLQAKLPPRPDWPD